MEQRPRLFLTAEWRYLAMLNYRVAHELLQPHVPAATTLDSWQGHTYVSVVGFLFRRTRVLGVPVLFHQSFEEVNLRFYTRREVDGEVRHAVTFLREVVRRRGVALAARLIYNEPYLVRPMRYRLGEIDRLTGAPSIAEYAWGRGDMEGQVAVAPAGPARPVEPGSEEEFIAQRHWGYTRQRDGHTVEYRVLHPPWRVWQASRAWLVGDLTPLCGAELARELARDPDSAWLADGSAVKVYAPVGHGEVGHAE